jgi:hypothetical protein
MLSGNIRRLTYSVTALALIATATFSLSGTAVADPGQDQKFFDLLGQKEIPPVDNANSLIATARKACAKLDEGMSVGDLVELIRNNGFKENPLTRFDPQDRITRTIDQFINASVEAYCPYDRGKIASIAAYRGRPGDSRLVVLASFVEPLPAGEILPTKPLPVPAQPPPPVPQEMQPPPQQPPPPPRHAPPVPQQAPPPPQEPPPPAEAPQEPPPEAKAPEPPPEAAPPAPPAPASPGGGGNAPTPGSPGGGAGGGNAPATPTPEQPAAPGHIRLAP